MYIVHKTGRFREQSLVMGIFKASLNFCQLKTAQSQLTIKLIQEIHFFPLPGYILPPDLIMRGLKSDSDPREPRKFLLMLEKPTKLCLYAT